MKEEDKSYINDLIYLMQIVVNAINNEISETLRGRKHPESVPNTLDYRVGLFRARYPAEDSNDQLS